MVDRSDSLSSSANASGAGGVHQGHLSPEALLSLGSMEGVYEPIVAPALPPFDSGTAERLVDGLRLRALLDARRDRPAAGVGAFCRAAARFSVLAAALGDVLREIDLNPVIVNADGCMAVDALVVGSAPKQVEFEESDPPESDNVSTMKPE